MTPISDLLDRLAAILRERGWSPHGVTIDDRGVRLILRDAEWATLATLYTPTRGEWYPSSFGADQQIRILTIDVGGVVVWTTETRPVAVAS